MPVEGRVALAADLTRRDNLPVQPPVPDMVVSSYYGWRTHPVEGTAAFHEGVDIAIPHSTPVHAPGGGVVDTAGYSPTYGLYLVLQHEGTGYRTRLAHLSDYPAGLRVGQHVRRGQLVAYSGETGRVTGPHLHFEVVDAQGRAVDPALVFKEYVALVRRLDDSRSHGPEVHSSRK